MREVVGDAGGRLNVQKGFPSGLNIALLFLTYSFLIVAVVCQEVKANCAVCMNG